MGRAGETVIGIVSDGCGEGRGSELGAALSSAIALETLRAGLAEGTPLEALPGRLAEALERGLESVARWAAPEGVARTDFVHDHLLATLLAFVACDGAAMIVAFGDGVILVDEHVAAISEDNRPTYPAYRLFGRRAAPRVLRFDRVDRIAVSTDGLRADELARIAGAASGRSDLERPLRVLQLEGGLEDDAAVVCATRSASMTGAPLRDERGRGERS